MSNEETLQGLMEIAKKNLGDSGSLLPILLVEGYERTIVGIPEMSRSAGERQALFYALGRRFAGNNVQCVTAVMDAYMKVQALGIELPLERSLADDPEATECIVVASLDGAPAGHRFRFALTNVSPP